MKLLIVTDSIFIRYTLSLISMAMFHRVRVINGSNINDVLGQGKFNYVFILTRSLEPEVEFFYTFKHADVYFYDKKSINGFYESYKFNEFHTKDTNLWSLCFKFAWTLRELETS